MPYLTIENYKYGLDTRRSELTSQAGVLSVCENAHINQGGEVEKRKAFVKDAATLINDSNGSQGTFGLESSSTNKVLFGSALPSTLGYTTTVGADVINVVSSGVNGKLNVTVTNGVITALTVNTAGTGYAANDWVSVTAGGGVGALIKILTASGPGGILTVSILHGQQQDQPVLASAMPAGYTYQQLKHPLLTDFIGMTNVYGTVNAGTTVANNLVQGDEVYYNSARHRITAIPFSISYKGNTWVAATFSDGHTYLYSNGVYIPSSYDGILFDSANFPTANSKVVYITYQVMRDIQALTGYGAAFDGPSTPITDISTDMESALGGALLTNHCRFAAPDTHTISSMVQTVSSAGGAFVSAHKAGSTVTAVPPVATFTVAGIAGNTYTVESSIGNNAFVRLCNAVAWAVSNANTAGLIVTAINTNTGIHGYSASNGGTAVVSVFCAFPTTPTLMLYGFTHAVLTVTSADATANGNHSFTGFYNFAFGEKGEVWVGGTWAGGDTWSISIVDAGTSLTVGKGRIAGLTYTSASVVLQRIYLASGEAFYFTGVDAPTGFESQNTGASFVNFQSQFGSVDTVQSFSIYQGRLAVFGVYSIQIWTPSANPSDFVRNQILQNIGTDAPFSVQPFGELDVFFRSLSGVRSLRVRDSSLNGYVTDVGSPIDGLLDDHTSTQRQASISIMEPTAHRYWLYEGGTIYVLSYFPTLKISAWSTYKPTYNVDTVFLPFGDHYDGSGNSSYQTLVAGNSYTWTKGANDTSLTFNGVTYTSTTTFEATVNGNATTVGTPSALVTASLVEHAQTAFTPEKFIVHQGQVFVRATSGDIFSLGGAVGTSYDYCVATVETPWLDVQNKVSTRKQSTSVDMIGSSYWGLKATMDYRTGTSVLKTLKVADGISSPDQGVLPFRSTGTHVKLQAKTSAAKAEAAVLSALIWHYNDAGEKRS